MFTYENQRIKEYLLKTGRFLSVSTWDSSTGTPLSWVLPFYDAVLVYSKIAHDDPDTLGDRLASYIDNGGGVVTAMYSYTFAKAISGDFNSTALKLGKTKNYWAILPSDESTSASAVSINKIIPNHPILNGITSLNTNALKPFNSIHANATRIANWSDGTPLIVTRDIIGARRVDLGFSPTNSSLTSNAGELTKDGDILIANALEWVANKSNESFLVPITGYLLLD